MMPAMIRLKTAAMALMLFAAFTAWAQDLVVVAPQAAKVEYEDARIRVVRLRVPENGSLPMHDRPARVVIPLTVNSVRTTRPDGKTSLVFTAAGQVAWSEPARRSVTNLGGPLENVIVELKHVAGPARPLAQPPSPHPAGYLEEGFHHWLFENQYVRVYDVRIPPGATTDYHVHAIDTVFVELAGEMTSEQVQGKPWGKPEKVDAGATSFSADSKQARTHRVRNEGKGEYHVIAVQLLQ